MKLFYNIKKKTKLTKVNIDIGLKHTKKKFFFIYIKKHNSMKCNFLVYISLLWYKYYYLIDKFK